jgi:hypothetical protein
LGFIAEDVPQEFGTADRKGVDAMSIVSALTLVVQQQQAQIGQLLTQIPQWIAMHSMSTGGDGGTGSAVSNKRPLLEQNDSWSAAYEFGPLLHKPAFEWATHHSSPQKSTNFAPHGGPSLLLASVFQSWRTENGNESVGGLDGESTRSAGTVDDDVFAAWPRKCSSLEEPPWFRQSAD